jgi:hypothetical protein
LVSFLEDLFGRFFCIGEIILNFHNSSSFALRYITSLSKASDQSHPILFPPLVSQPHVELTVSKRPNARLKIKKNSMGKKVKKKKKNSTGIKMKKKKKILNGYKN